MNRLQEVALGRTADRLESMDVTSAAVYLYETLVITKDEYERINAAIETSKKRMELLDILKITLNGWDRLLETLRKQQRSYIADALEANLEQLCNDIRDGKNIPEVFQSQNVCFTLSRPDPYLEDSTGQIDEIVGMLLDLGKTKDQFNCIILNGPSGQGKSIRVAEVVRKEQILKTFHVAAWTRASGFESVTNVIYNICTQMDGFANRLKLVPEDRT